MKNRHSNLSVSGALIILTGICLICVAITISCGRDSDSPVSQDQAAILPKSALTEASEDARRYRWGLLSELTGQQTGISECGGYTDTRYTDIPPTQEAVVWEWDGHGTLTLHRVNAGFNCCTDVYGDISFAPGAITVTDREEGDHCYCLCLYDVDYEIENLRPDFYSIQFVELYLSEGDAPLEFAVKLGPEPGSGTYVVDRANYPWGYVGSPEGELVSRSGCGGWTTASLGDDPPADSNCFIWEYENGTLDLTHQNATFNCCVLSLSAEFTFSNDTIFITESEVLDQGGCACICPYDVAMKITNLPVGAYTVVVDGPWDYNDTRFTLDLTAEPDGYHCYLEALDPL